MPKKKKISPTTIIILLVVAVFLFKNTDEMSFYQHRECFVDNEQAGCEAEGGALTINYIKDPTFAGTGSCNAFMQSKGCQPENCFYYGAAMCGTDSKDTMVDNSCTSDKDCIEKFENTGYRCFREGPTETPFCKFEGNHLPDEYAGRTDLFQIEDEEEFSLDEWAKKNELLFVLLGGLLLIWFLLWTFSSERPRFIVK